MSRRSVDLLVAYVYAAVCFAVVLAPAIAVRYTSASLDIEPAGLDLIIASSVIGGIQAVMAWIRLRCEERTAVRRLDMWIAALNSLVVLALSATMLLMVVLVRFADEHAYMANRGYPVVLLWGGVQLLAVVLAEAVGRFVFWWLEPHPQTHHLHIRWSVMPSLRRRRVPRGGRTPTVHHPVSGGSEPALFGTLTFENDGGHGTRDGAQDRGTPHGATSPVRPMGHARRHRLRRRGGDLASRAPGHHGGGAADVG